jgi:ribonuclease E
VRAETPGEPAAGDGRPAAEGSIEPTGERRRRRRRRRRRGGGAGAIRPLTGSPPLTGSESGSADADADIGSRGSGDAHEDLFDEAPDEERGADSDES